ncbi:hypothetical protein A1O3_02076 [Capronia epimyces CBS 606.96]|uniref:tRNA wybutosine-synthesizing protein 4 n=1 Tax=Capronia epimyces CBS 606.96 TaxID=1182542 RepID=W9Y843_9EURO|nr:uncharacterized protein A1O3_02076 [Capronia epimyces CBS 606.96]EXJ89012.1 hypothetical protein A1O3_02076 [Capronia epimyces CBS 606.96]
MGATEHPGNDVFNDGIQLERNAGLLMATNTTTIALKGNAESLYLPKPHFYKQFAKQQQPVRPSAAVNRGYWLRMRAIEWVVRQFLEKPSAHRKVIVNLGCGYDLLPFQWLSRENHLCATTKFVDVDYEPLLQTKCEIILNRHDTSNLLRSVTTNPTATNPILLDSREYAAIGCDLRNLRRLDRLLKSVCEPEQSIVLCIAEDSVAYMPTEAADALIAWSSSLSSDTTFCLLDPICPDQPDNPFTAKMASHYTKLGTPLRSVFQYPGQHSHTQRFRVAGFTQLEYQNLWELWADPRFLSPSQRMALDGIEPFDAWEEFALWASHHCLAVAHNRGDPVLPERVLSRRNSDSSDASDISTRTSAPTHPDSQLFAFRYYKDPGCLCRRHHGSSYPIPDQDAIAIYGGQGPESILATSAVCRPRHLDEVTPVVLPPEVGARCCHVLTGMNDGGNILVGGRRSLTEPLKDCWLQKGNRWFRIHDLPEPRYRCRVVGVTLPNHVFGAICYGGKTGPATVATDILLWEPNVGWRVLQHLRNTPVPRFGPNFIRLGFNHGLLFGGMRQDGVICPDLWRWRLVVRDNVVAGISFRPSHALHASIGAYPWFARFGASYGFVQDYLLVIGGVARGGCIPQPYEILSLIGSFSNLGDGKELGLRVTSVQPVRPPDCPRPFLIGHSTLRTRTGMYVILGGGATCYTYGDYFNEGIWVLHEKEAGLTADWVVVPSRASSISAADSDSGKNGPSVQPVDVVLNRTQLADAVEFVSVVRRSRPRVITDLDFGTGARLWSLDHLMAKTTRSGNSIPSDELPQRRGWSRLEDSSGHQITCPAKPVKLRVSSSIATNTLLQQGQLDKPPELDVDFRIPWQLKSIETHVDSVLLDVSRGTTLLQYDTTATVLFQVKGLRKVALFPPTDLNRLEILPGLGRCELRVFNEKTRAKPLQAPPGTSPHVAIIQPGDSLFIPPFWTYSATSMRDFGLTSHDCLVNKTQQSQSQQTRSSRPTSVTSESSCSSGYTSESATECASPASLGRRPPLTDDTVDVTIKVFFRTITADKYTKSAGGFREAELVAYEAGRRDVENIVKRFINNNTQPARLTGQETSGLTGHEETETKIEPAFVLDQIPKDVTKAFLEKLGRELLAKAAEL